MEFRVAYEQIVTEEEMANKLERICAHAYEFGCDHMSLILNNLAGKENSGRIGCYDENIYMMKNNELKVMRI